jgi:hypothetical protein
MNAGKPMNLSDQFVPGHCKCCFDIGADEIELLGYIQPFDNTDIRVITKLPNS